MSETQDKSLEQIRQEYADYRINAEREIERLRNRLTNEVDGY